MTAMQDGPRSLRHQKERERRLAMLALPHMAPLADYVRTLRSREGCYVPDFDPCDGGTGASILFLFEKPGPKTDPRNGGSGFISRDNDDPTAAATFSFMSCAGLRREQTVIWNTIPWWNATRAMTRTERSDGEAEVERLMALLPKVLSVVLVGRTAARAQRLFSGLHPIVSDHPGPLVRARHFSRWKDIPNVWRRALSASEKIQSADARD